MILNLKNHFLAHGVIENRYNVKLLWDVIGLNRIKFYLCADHKMNNIVFGIQPHGSKYPCYICSAMNPKKPGVDWENSELRTLGMIRSQCANWRNAGGVMRQAQEYQSCVSRPFFYDDDEKLTISLCPISELHILLRVFNNLFKHFAKKWEELGVSLEFVNGDSSLASSFTNPAQRWAATCGAIQKSCHGQAFNGNGCSKLLSPSALHELEQILPFGPLQDYLDCFHSLAKVKQACFGLSLFPDYHSKIAAFKKSFLVLGINVTPCTHILFEHIQDFIDLCYQDDDQSIGLGFYSEQSFEAMHSIVAKTMERFPSNQYCEAFAAKSLRGMCAVNSRHI